MMNLLDLLQASGGEQSLGKLAKTLGINEIEAKSVVGALSPALIKSLQNQALGSSGLDKLQSALQGGKHQRYIEEPDLLESESTRADGNKILGHLFGSKSVSRNVASVASKETGIGDDIIKKALPLVAGLAMGALSKKQTQQTDQDSAGLGNLLGSMLGGGDSLGLDDVMGFAKKLF